MRFVSTQVDQLHQCCLQGDPGASLKMLLLSHRHMRRDMFEVGFAGCFLCDDDDNTSRIPGPEAKRRGYLLGAVLKEDKTVDWKHPVWQEALSGL